jgi:hypothetical protein
VLKFVKVVFVPEGRARPAAATAERAAMRVAAEKQETEGTAAR